MSTFTRDELPIVLIEATGPVEKVPNRRGLKAPEYRLPIRYTCEGGEVFETGSYWSTKKAATEEAAQYPGAPRNPMAVTLHDGRFVGTRTSYYIGPR
jgi:hypothetical protein